MLSVPQNSMSSDVRDLLNITGDGHYQQDTERKCQGCGKPLYRAYFNKVLDRLECRNIRCQQFKQHQGYVKREKVK